MLTLSAAVVIALLVSSPVSGCDAAASHPDDPDRTWPGLEREEIDLAAAEKACQYAHLQVPESARTAYHFGRVLFYQGRRQEALTLLERASEAGYRQATFVLGYVLSTGAENVPKNICRAQQLWRRGIALEHPWSGYHLVDKQLLGSFSSCQQQVSAAELIRFFDIATRNITVTASAGRV